MKKKIILLVALISLTSLFACKGEEQEIPPQETPKPMATQEKTGDEVDKGFTMDTAPIKEPEKKPAMIINVPDDIQSAWSAVEIEVILNKDTDNKVTYTLKLNDEITIKGSNIKVKALHFMPNFTMGSGVMTSIDAEPVNPAVHLLITEGDYELWNGVAFQNHPDTHAFLHDKYFILMKKYIPSEEK